MGELCLETPSYPKPEFQFEDHLLNYQPQEGQA